MIIRAENKFLVHKDRNENSSNELELYNCFNQAINISLEYVSEIGFKIKYSDKYITLSENKLFLSDNGSIFYIGANNLITESEIVFKNVHFLNVTSSPVIEAIKSDNYEMLTELLESGNLYKNCIDTRGNSSLMVAVQFNSLKSIEILHKFNAIEDLNMQNFLGNTMMHEAIEQVINGRDILKYLFENKLIPDILSDEKGFCPFTRACTRFNGTYRKEKIYSNLKDIIKAYPNKGKYRGWRIMLGVLL